MIERAHIVVEGPAGAGKTTFIERLLSSNRARLIAAARFRARGGLKEPVELPEGDADTERFSFAGAEDTVLIHHPPGQARHTAEFIFETDLMHGFTHAVIHEVDEELDIAPDMHVLIFRPTERQDEIWDSQWAAELGRANLVILNVGSPEERAVAERLVEEVDRLQAEEAVQWASVRYATGAGRKFKIRIADLLEPKDRELKRALTSVKRKIPSGAPEEEYPPPPTHHPPPSTYEDEELLQVKITLDGIDPPIWRRILLWAGCSYWDLHVAIQNAMGWDDEHRHVFTVDQKGSGERNVLIGPPDPHSGREIMPSWNEPVLNHLALGSSALYTYDLTDNWHHVIDIETLRLAKPGQTYPACVEGERSCPPEECGGPQGYVHLLEALSDPDHEDFGEMTDWCMEKFDGGWLDPDEFDPAKTRFENPKAKLRWAGAGRGLSF
jgi:hypothetical protein